MIKLARRLACIAASLAMLLLVFGVNTAFGSDGHREYHRQHGVDVVIQRAMKRGPRALAMLLQHPSSRAVVKELEVRLNKDPQVRKELARGGRFMKQKARAAANECTLEWIKIQRTTSGNTSYAQGTVGQSCVPPATEQYACGELDEYWLSDNEWHDMSYTCGSVVYPESDPGQWSWAFPKARCKSSAEREYRVMADGWAYISGRPSNAHTDWGYKYLACVS